MINKIISGVMNWLLVSVVIPAMAWIWDVWKLRKENKELKKKIEVLKGAKSKEDIDAAIDSIN